MAHRTPLTSLVCAPFHSWISLGMNDLVGKREGRATEWEKVKKCGGVVCVIAGPFSNLKGD